MRWRRLGAAAVAVGVVLLVAPGVSDAAAEEGIGYTTPAQGYIAKPGNTDWVGSYIWRGKHVWCVQYALLAPDSDVEYSDGDELRTKAGADLPDDVASYISYLLLRYSTTTSADESAALAHLLHSWTAAPQPGLELDPDVATYLTVAYDEQFHYDGLPPTAQQAVNTLRQDAIANRGPWTVTATEPEDSQTIGTPGAWRIDVTKADDSPVRGAPLTVEVVGGELENGGTTGEFTTPTDGTALEVQVTPTEEEVSLVVKLDSPADRPVVHVPDQGQGAAMQRIVTTGGEKKLTAQAETVARTAPAEVRTVKTDSETGRPIGGVALRFTAGDGVSPAIGQDDRPLVGADDKPVVIQTADDGSITVPEVRTPQEVCVVEVAAPRGYEEDFDPNAPPKVCTTAQPGQKVDLALRNKPNKPIVPLKIPAGVDGSGVVATGASTTRTDAGALIGYGGGVLVAGVLLGAWVRRRATART
ncbi:hypothetical protein GCM10022243_21490 [Saccharothrix violaceirubra]|uniref:Uncharacterized protein YjeT (DUF2065 family) n=1 Tax=Saccharothrix violaceirubra TaxID=413306 RepID=A0A7W7T8H7_9PSEU|nr:hypothetical protein [Saccharothrix violaceirubra]MBB4968511.1 uncharacterized protein YjeT (DUF2065 family) [Saccharothrix violaceirubra]